MVNKFQQKNRAMSDARRGLSLQSKYRQHAVKGGCIKIVEQHCAIIFMS